MRISSKDIPSASADLEQLVDFARSFDGYAHWGEKAIPRLLECEEEWQNSGVLPKTLADLRAVLFMSWRSYDRGGQPGELSQFFFAVLERIRNFGRSEMQSQRVTENDITNGQVRIPIDTKVMFPGEATTLEVVLRGRSLSGKWNPRMGPDKERSGILGVGKAALEALVAPNEVLEVTSTEKGLILS